MKYLIDEYIMKKSQNGTPALAGIGMFASRAMYKSFSSVYDNLQQMVLANLMMHYMNVKNTFTCQTFLNATIDNLTQD